MMREILAIGRSAIRSPFSAGSCDSNAIDESWPSEGIYWCGSGSFGWLAVSVCFREECGWLAGGILIQTNGLFDSQFTDLVPQLILKNGT